MTRSVEELSLESELVARSWHGLWMICESRLPVLLETSDTSIAGRARVKTAA